MRLLLLRYKLLLPEMVLGITGAKCKYGIREPLPVALPRSDPHQDGAVASPFEHWHRFFHRIFPTRRRPPDLTKVVRASPNDHPNTVYIVSQAGPQFQGKSGRAVRQAGQTFPVVRIVLTVPIAPTDIGL
jgi:hypothetical protein